MLKQSTECDVFVIAVGGGGLIAGIRMAQYLESAFAPGPLPEPERR